MNAETTAAKTENQPSDQEPTRSGPLYRPNVDIVEREAELVVLADMPGLRSGDIDVDFEDGVLTIHGRVEPRWDENTRFLQHEYGVGDFHRTFQVSENIDTENIAAEYRDGVLSLTLPKAPAARPRKIDVAVK